MWHRRGTDDNVGQRQPLLEATATRNPFSEAGYSIVLWHAWSKSVDNVMTVVNGLAPHVKVIPPDSLVKMVGKHTKQ
ncbi:hypothetical protein AB0F43_33575 [Kribbella sp. NPDC023972]|uniref:hypothetical protein n=1 Tax=Kribbella sp. NPDC023972 TaxID=3154795 RepID=UPI0033FB3424